MNTYKKPALTPSPSTNFTLMWHMPGLAYGRFTIGEIRDDVSQKRNAFWDAIPTYDDLVLIGNFKTLDRVVGAYRVVDETTDRLGFYVCRLADKYSPDDRLSFIVKRGSVCHAVSIEDWGKK